MSEPLAARPDCDCPKNLSRLWLPCDDCPLDYGVTVTGRFTFNTGSRGIVTNGKPPAPPPSSQAQTYGVHPVLHTVVFVVLPILLVVAVLTYAWWP